MAERNSAAMGEVLFNIDTDYPYDIYNMKRSSVMSSSERFDFCNDSGQSLTTSSLFLLQVYTNKTITYLRASAMVPYQIHVVLLNLTHVCHRMLIDE